MKEIISLPLLSQIVLDDETAVIMKEVENRKRSEFARGAIVEFAKEKGYIAPTLKPVYIPLQKWQVVVVYQEKSRRTDYDYVIAYFFLQSLPEYSFMQKSQVIREAIKQYKFEAE